LMIMFKFVTALRMLQTLHTEKQMSICLVVQNTRNLRNLVTGKEATK